MITIDGIEYALQCPACAEDAAEAPLFDPMPDGFPADLTKWPTRCGRLEMARCDCCGKWFSPD